MSGRGAHAGRPAGPGGGRPGRRRAARTPLRALVPLWVPAATVFGIAGIGLLRVLTQHWREGAALLAGALLTAGVLRAALPDDRAGLLAVRSRVIDVAFYVTLGLVTLALAVTITRSLGFG